MKKADGDFGRPVEHNSELCDAKAVLCRASHNAYYVGDGKERGNLVTGRRGGMRGKTWVCFAYTLRGGEPFPCSSLSYGFFTAGWQLAMFVIQKTLALVF